ncbi:MAG TPA: hypothetical protein VEP90_20655, partial [Methylomirabilota bacterium]|nr:hypothetical protein [Methylomirabilota bacterium]
DFTNYPEYRTYILYFKSNDFVACRCGLKNTLCELTTLPPSPPIISQPKPEHLFKYPWNAI